MDIEFAPVFRPLIEPSRYKAAYGGRGSGKSHFFADLAVANNIKPGSRGVCIREVQKDLKDSAKLLIEDKIYQRGLAKHGFEPQRDLILTPGGGQIIFRGMNNYTADSIKSLEGFDWAWIEEAHTFTAKSLELLRPTIRKPGSEIWASWNPRFDTDPIDALFRADELPTGSSVVQANWSDNPWFPEVLEQERLDCLRLNPDQYGHIWEGEYVSIVDGAYFADGLRQAKEDKRITDVPVDSLQMVRAYCDIGGTGKKSDAFAIWIVQFIGRSIYLVDYYEAVGQPGAAHINWLRKSGYKDALVVLPHDGETNDKVIDINYRKAFEAAGFDVEVVPNQGAGAARNRIERARQLFPRMWFDEKRTGPGRKALGWYHEKIDEDRRFGLGPEHDWSSHAADAFGMMAIHYEEPTTTALPELETEWVV